VSVTSYKMRFISIARRNYSRSSPYSDAEMRVITNGTEEEKKAFMSARGLELAKFWDIFIQDQDIPEVTEDGSSGGILILGWSLGCSYTLAAISAILKLPPKAQNRLASRIRGLVLYGEH
jgi:pimeloyl-ACP methyl ester carboxylesterase